MVLIRKKTSQALLPTHAVVRMCMCIFVQKIDFASILADLLSK